MVYWMLLGKSPEKKLVRNAAGQFLGLANITGGVLRVEKLFVERN